MMTHGNVTQKVLFSTDLPAENIVRAVLVMLQSYYERELERVNDILAGFPDFYTDKLAAVWTQIKAESQSDTEALCLLTRVIAAELDGGNGPVV